MLFFICLPELRMSTGLEPSYFKHQRLSPWSITALPRSVRYIGSNTFTIECVISNRF